MIEMIFLSIQGESYYDSFPSGSKYTPTQLKKPQSTYSLLCDYNLTLFVLTVVYEARVVQMTV